MDMETAAENVEEAAKDVNRLVEYVNSQIPNIINFGLKVVLSLICFFIGRKLIRWVQKLVRASLNRANVDKGVEQFVDSMLKVVLYCILIFSLVANFGVDTTSIAALFASGGVAIGLALQGSLSNFAGGVLILLLKPFVVGDYIIESGTGNEGTVKEIQIFYTKLSTVDNRMIVIPNGALSNNSLTNVTAKEKRRLEIKVGISYMPASTCLKSYTSENATLDHYYCKEPLFNTKKREPLAFRESSLFFSNIIGYFCYFSILPNAFFFHFPRL